jgi:hypothetical protein
MQANNCNLCKRITAIYIKRQDVYALFANSFGVLENLKSLDFPMEGCNDFISTDVTEMEMQLSQSPCSVLANDSVNPNKKARLEKVEKNVTFNLAITTEKDKKTM